MLPPRRVKVRPPNVMITIGTDLTLLLCGEISVIVHPLVLSEIGIVHVGDQCPHLVLLIRFTIVHMQVLVDMIGGMILMNPAAKAVGAFGPIHGNQKTMQWIADLVTSGSLMNSRRERQATKRIVAPLTINVRLPNGDPTTMMATVLLIVQGL